MRGGQARQQHPSAPSPGPMNPDPTPSPVLCQHRATAGYPPPGPESLPSYSTVISAQVIRENATGKLVSGFSANRLRMLVASAGDDRDLNDEAELARMAAIQERLLELARRAVRKNVFVRPTSRGGGGARGF